MSAHEQLHFDPGDEVIDAFETETPFYEEPYYAVAIRQSRYEQPADEPDAQDQPPQPEAGLRPISTAERAEYEDLVRKAGVLCGFSNMQVSVNPGEGFYTLPGKDNIRINVDPTMMVTPEQKAAGLTEPDPRFVAYGVFHEFGHVKDMLDTEGDEKLATDPKRHFFNNIVDDATINQRIRRIPAINACTDEVYGDVLFPFKDAKKANEYSKAPKHVQLMHGLLNRAVVPNNPQPQLSPEVAEAVDRIFHHPSVKRADQLVDVMSTLAKDDTSLIARRKIAEKTIWPAYEKFYNEDREKQEQKKQQQEHQNKQNDNKGEPQQSEQSKDQNQQNDQQDSSEQQPQDSSEQTQQADDQKDEPKGESSEDQSKDQSDAADGEPDDQEPDSKDGQSQGGKDDQSQDSTEGQPDDEADDSGADDKPFEEWYEEYDKTAHGEHEHGDEDGDDAEDDKSEDSPDTLHDAMKKAAESHQEQEADKQAAQQQAAEDESSQPTPEEQIRSDRRSLAKNIAGPMKLRQNEALYYADSVLRKRAAIRQVAEVWKRLALPTEEIRSPRYSNIAQHDGRRLDPRKTAQAGVQIRTGDEKPVWQRTTRQAARQESSFGGLDVFAVTDISDSMAQNGHKKALAAGDINVVLTESLDYARDSLKRENPKAPKPDVRLGMLVFGTSTAEMSPLGFYTDPRDKGRAFTNIINPTAEGTLVNPALKAVKKNALANPGRHQLAIITTDGACQDYILAQETMRTMPQNVSVFQLQLEEIEKRYHIGKVINTTADNIVQVMSGVVDEVAKQLH